MQCRIAGRPTWRAGGENADGEVAAAFFNAAGRHTHSGVHPMIRAALVGVSGYGRWHLLMAMEQMLLGRLQLVGATVINGKEQDEDRNHRCRGNRRNAGR